MFAEFFQKSNLSFFSQAICFTFEVILFFNQKKLIKMKILKFTLFSLLCNLFFINQLSAQILLPGLPTEPTEVLCNDIVPNLVIDHLYLESLDEYTYVHITFNESDFENFDHYEVRTTNNFSGHTTIGPSAIIIIKVPETGGPGNSFVSCNFLDLSFQIKAVCNGEEHYSNTIFSQNLTCNSNEFRKAIEEYTVNVVQSSASNIVYFRGLHDIQISSVGIYNLDGQELFAKINNSSSSIFEINVSSLTPGMYIAKVFIDEETFILKKVVVR